ncbi:MAG: class I SAM-dependent rRNA methyltransferase [Chloroflexota bacterium]
MIEIKLKNKRDSRLLAGHLWAFSNELAELPETQAGELVRVRRANGEDLGLAFYNRSSLISLRLLGEYNRFGAEEIAARIKSAARLRDLVFDARESRRLVFGESDSMPGLVLDRYNDVIALQILSAGFERLLPELLQAIKETFPEVTCIYEKNESRARLLEGLEEREGTLFGEAPKELIIEENGLKYSISLEGGQKTGYFLDQRFNRLFLRKISRGSRVLDCFCNQGGFALNAAAAGAVKVVGIDVSADAIEASKVNANLNGLTNASFERADVFDFLKSASPDWDVIVLDPPAFAKSKKNVPEALRGYAAINRHALRLLNKGGFLATSSCSHHIGEHELYALILREAARLGKSLRLVFRGSQPPDHPILASMPETEYLKFFVFQVV